MPPSFGGRGPGGSRNRRAGIRVIVATAALLLAATLAVRAQDGATQAEALTRRAAERLAALRAEADRLTQEARTLLGDLRRLEVERQIKREELRQVEAESAQVTRELGTLDTQIRALEEQVQLEIPRLRARLVSVYKLGQGRYARLLLSTTDLANLSQAVRLATGLAAQDRSRIELYETRRRELEEARTGLEARKQRLAVLRTAAADATRAANEALAARNALIARIDQRRDLNAQLTGELQAAHEKLQATVREFATGATTALTPLPLSPFKGDLTWPAAGAVRQRFGSSPRAGAPVSNGLDIASPEGSQVVAVHDGTVAFAGPFSGFGQLVIVDHGAQAYSLYGNLRETAAVAGARVTAGASIGTVGVAPTGAAGLYFELRVDGRPVDPLQWLKNR